MNKMKITSNYRKVLDERNWQKKEDKVIKGFLLFVLAWVIFVTITALIQTYA